MSKPIKEMVRAELASRYADARSACVVDLTGLSVQSTERLRRALREKSARVQVVKNSMARRAFAGTALEPLGNALEGPCALVTSEESIIDAAKSLVELAKEFASLQLKQALFEGDPALLTVEQLSRMRSKSEIIGEAAMLIASPGRALAGCLSSPQGKIAGCLKAMIEKAA
jgi:large subunit ribosomal protein L10